MNLLILGCGTIIQEGKAENCSGYLIDKNILIDCGPGIWRALHQHQIDLNRISCILLSHFHVDHTSDLAPILQERYLTDTNQEWPLTIVGPKGLNPWYKRLTGLIGKWSREMNTHLIEIGRFPIKLNDYTIGSMKTLHTPNSISYRLDKCNSSLFYSGDSDFNERLQNLARECQIAIMEASNTEQTKIPGHLTPFLAGKLAAASSVKRLLLTHRYPEVRKNEALQSAAQVFKGELDVAEEGMIIEF